MQEIDNFMVSNGVKFSIDLCHQPNNHMKSVQGVLNGSPLLLTQKPHQKYAKTQICLTLNSLETIFINLR